MGVCFAHPPFAAPLAIVRSGRKGRSGEPLAPAQQTQFDDWCKQGLARPGSTLRGLFRRS